MKDSYSKLTREKDFFRNNEKDVLVFLNFIKLLNKFLKPLQENDKRIIEPIFYHIYQLN